MDKILTSLKVSKANVVTIKKPLTYFFKDLISEILLVLFPIELNIFYLELLLPVMKIFFRARVTTLSKNKKKPLTT